MKQFEIYMADLSSFGLETGTPVVILQSVFNGTDRILCAPVTSRESNDDTHIMVNIQNGKMAYIMSGQIRNIDKEKLRGKIGELTEEGRQKVKDRFLELMK